VVTGSAEDAPAGLALLSAHSGGPRRSSGADRLFARLGGHAGAVTSVAAAGTRMALSGGGLGDRRVNLWAFDLVGTPLRTPPAGPATCAQKHKHSGLRAGARALSVVCRTSYNSPPSKSVCAPLAVSGQWTSGRGR
jgi:hypothetical protein